MPSNVDQNLLNYFTDVEHLRTLFQEFVTASVLSKRVIVIHGVGGVGKSSLLGMFQLYCKEESVPIGVASGDDAKSVVEIVTRWMDDLTGDGLKFSSLRKSVKDYRAIQSSVDEQLKRSQVSRSRLADIAGKAASKTAETAGGAVVGAAIGSVVPGIGTAIGGTLGGVLGGMGAEALVDWLRGFLAKPDIDLLLDPSKRLTADFLEDLAAVAGKRRIVLILDTFEQLSALDDWAGDLAQKLHPNVLVVVAGRRMPDWQRAWPGWMAAAQIEELKPMTETVMRALIRRYYATMKGGEPDSLQVDAIIRFARGLPIVVTTAVQLWVKYGVEDFQTLKAEIVANLVDQIIDGVPPALIPALESAAAVRWFDQPILRALTGLGDVRELYNELRKFPFVRTRAEGVALHDSIREILDENLRVQDSERHRELHRRAAEYFEKKADAETGEETGRLLLERLYHRVRENEKANLPLLQSTLDELIRYRLLNRFREIVNDFNTYPLDDQNSKLWREYYNAQLAYLLREYDAARDTYKRISDDSSAEARLRAYALCEQGKLGNSMELVRAPHGLSALVNIVEESNSLLPESDLKRAENFVTLGIAYPHVGDIDKASASFESAIALYEGIGDLYGLGSVYSQMKVMHGVRGDWAKMFEARQRGLERFPQAAAESYVYSSLFGNFAIGWILAGRYAEAETFARRTLAIGHKIGIVDPTGTLDDLVMSLACQEKYEEAHRRFQESMHVAKTVYDWENPVTLNFYGFALIREGDFLEAEKHLKTSLAINEKLPPRRNPPENLQWLALLYETQQDWSTAEHFNDRSLEFRWIGRRYYECAALTGLVRIRYAQRMHSAIPELLASAEKIALAYQYNDQLASLRLTQAHLALDSGNQSDALLHYKQALIYALRYNRYLLDEMIQGRTQGSVFRPILQMCLDHGQAGKQVVVALAEWWKDGTYSIGESRALSISPIPEGISLLEAEKIAREREPGDGSAQKAVLEQFADGL